MSKSPCRQRRAEKEAAHWLGLRDTGEFTASERDAYEAWLAADLSHAAAAAELEAAWRTLDKLQDFPRPGGERSDPDFLAPPRKLWPAMPVALAAAAVLLFGAFLWRLAGPAPSGEGGGRPFASTNAVRQVSLPDGSIAELNVDSEFVEKFTPAERRIELLRGEADFTVAKNHAWPFVVTARGVKVRAVGTTFNVRMNAAAVEVLVTEGRVQVEREPSLPLQARLQIPSLVAGQQAVIHVARGAEATPPTVGALSPDAIHQALSWESGWLDFDGTPFAVAIACFNHKADRRLVIDDDHLAALRISGRFRASDVEDFVQLLEAGFGVMAERTGDGTIILREREKTRSRV